VALITERPSIPAQSAVPAPVDAAASRLADPGPLGLGAFAMTTFILSCVNAGWLPKSVEGVVLGLALFYGGIAQLLAGMWEFAKGNTFGAVAFTSYGAFWLSFWYLVAHVTLDAPAADAAKGVGFFLLGWTIFTAYMLVCALRTNGVLIGVFGCLTLTFLCLTIGELNGSSGLTHAGGYLGLATAVLGWYGSMAGVLNSLNKTGKTATLPIFARS
jgi:succinate-acetate transporter protein